MLFTIADVDVKIWDILDVVIVAYLIYLIYKLLKGTKAFNIFIGVVLMYIIYWVVGKMEMRMLSLVLGKFVAYGVIILIIIFQPEVRNFLVMLGNTTLRGRVRFLNQFVRNNLAVDESKKIEIASEIENAIFKMSKDKTGALIIMISESNIAFFEGSGTQLNAKISDILIRNIFTKSAPLHDGALIISGQKILSASVILPVSESIELSKDLGLRHRAAIGISEQTNSAAFVVSEETGSISYVFEGKLENNFSKKKLHKLVLKHL